MAPIELSLHSASSRPNRSHSISSDRPSLTGYGGLLSPPTLTEPEPAYIAASAASQIVTNDHDGQADSWLDQHGIEPSGETAMVSPAALKLVNRFLDQLLFNFLSISKSTSLVSLRPAVAEVLKPKLAKGAVSGADQELHEYLGGGEDEELMAFHNGLEPTGDWDLELVWKRTRLRCMVYSSLGDMEEEDEDFYTEQEHLEGPPGSNNRFSHTTGVVSPAVAIFLTSILEFMGEQVLVVAGQASYHRLRVKHDREDKDDSTANPEIAERVVVEEGDMERVALDRTLGRLWRGWKKRIRSPTTSVSMTRSFSRESMRSQAQASRSASIAPDESLEEEWQRPSIAAALLMHDHAAAIPLPISDDDVREIEIPGLAKQIDDEVNDGVSIEEDMPHKRRPKSLLISTFHPGDELLTPASSQVQTPIFVVSPSRKRSYSLPSPVHSIYTSPSAKRAKGSDEKHNNSEVRESPGLNEVIEKRIIFKSDEQPAGDRHTEPTQTGVIAKEQVDAKPDEHQVRSTDLENEQPEEPKGLMSGVIAGAAAMGATAVAGIAAVLTGHAPQTELDHQEELDAEKGEPQIQTPHHISVGVSPTPDDPTVASRQNSVRANNVDVASSESPPPSRHLSGDGTEYLSVNSSFESRPQSVSSSMDGPTPRASMLTSGGPTTHLLPHVGSQISSRWSRNSAESNSEERTAIEIESAPPTAVPTDIAAAMQGVDLEDFPVSQQPISEAPPTDVVPQASVFILSPAPRKNRGDKSPLGEPQAPQSTSNLGVSIFKSHVVEGGVPPLTPLREMMEGAADTSDEASSLAPSQDGYSLSEYGTNGHSPQVSGSSIAMFQRDPQTKAGRPRAASVTRSSPPQSSRDDPARREQSKRPTHTSGSASGSSLASHKLKPLRTSEESAAQATGDKSESFEQLMLSDQTIQYTLTPPNMRNIEGLPESPRSPRMAVPAVASHPQEAARPPTSRSHSSSISKSTGLHSNPTVEPSKLVKPAKLSKSAPVPTANTGAKLRSSAPQPRDARSDGDSLGDLADFISSSTPSGTREWTSASQTAAASSANRGTISSIRNGSISRQSTATSIPRRSESSAGRIRLQARDAAIARDDSISDLIDFVRSGPQLEKQGHRVPRTVAPFRTTMDSDQMNDAVGEKVNDIALPNPRSSQASVSMHSSINSQSALISGSTKTNKAVQVQSLNNFEEEDRMPKRKQRRVRDMYQIDFSDEDEDEHEAISRSRPKPIKEESLAEFLANVPPPPDSSPAPLYSVLSKSGKMKKKTSTTSLMSRFGRRDSAPTSPPKPKSSGNDARTSTRPPQLPLHSPISLHFTSAKPNTYEPARGKGSDYVSQLDSSRNKATVNSYVPREAVYTETRTSDLAAFLRDSEPSMGSAQPRTFQPTLQKEETKTFQRMFGRKKVQ